ncbi:MAG: BBP7 family outer membrane beta-barrel protein [Planctomycetaceae bacterium]|nr:BBP7 family outer membrane beta-barrel protein [Planctomycetaceae bacterium]
MSRRFTLTLLGLISLGSLPRAEAQAPYANPDLGVMPSGWQQAGPGPKHSYHAPAAYGPVGPIPAGPGQTIYRELPDDKGWLYEDSPLERSLKDTFRHSYIRFDYLLWDIEDPGQNLLSAPTNLSAAINPVNPTDVFFPLTDPATGNQVNVVQPSLTRVLVNENNGVRATFGLPVFNAGTFEASVFALQSSTTNVPIPEVRGIATLQNSSLETVDTNGDGTFDALDFPVSINLVNSTAQAVLIDGELPVGDNFLLVNDLGYQASLKTSVWGAEANFLSQTFNPNDALSAMPFVGFRYFNFREDLRQSGQYNFSTFDPLTGEPGPPIASERRIDATTNNNVFGPQIGLRGELRNKWFSLGVQPKVMMGLNSYKAELMTQGILRPAEAERVLYEKSNTFGVIGDLEVYSKIRFSDHVSLRVGYNFLWSGMITRPADNTVYNIQSATGGLPATSAFIQDVKFSGAILQGLSVGGEIAY